MAVTINAVGIDDVGVFSDPSDFTSQITITAGATGLLVAIFVNAGSAGTIGVVWDQGGTNQAMTQVGTAVPVGGSIVAKFFGLVNPTTGNKTIRVTGIPAGQFGIASLAFNGGNTASAAAHFNTFTAATNTNNNATINLTSAVGNMMVGFSGTIASSPTALGQTGWFTGGFITWGGNYTNGAGSTTLTQTYTGTPTWDYFAINVSAAAAAGNPVGGWFQPLSRPARAPDSALKEKLVNAQSPPAVQVLNGWFQPLSLSANPFPAIYTGVKNAPSPPAVQNIITDLGFYAPLSPPARALPPWNGGVSEVLLPIPSNSITDLGFFAPLSPPAKALPPWKGGVTELLIFTPTVFNTVLGVPWIQPLSKPAPALPPWKGGVIWPPEENFQQPNSIVGMGWFAALSRPAAALPPWKGGIVELLINTVSIANTVPGIPWISPLSKPAAALPPWKAQVVWNPRGVAAIDNSIVGMGWFQNLSRPARALPPWKQQNIWVPREPPYLNTVGGVPWMTPLTRPAPPWPAIMPPMPPWFPPLIVPDVPEPVPPLQAFGGSGPAASRTAWLYRSQGFGPGLLRKEKLALANTLPEEERKQMLIEIDDDDVAFLLLNMDNPM